MFSSTLKDIIQVQSKTNQLIRKNLMITFQGNAFRLMLLSKLP